MICYILIAPKTQSLGAPYGDCAAKSLKHYPGKYSKLKCTKECEAAYIDKECSCVSPQQPGRSIIHLETTTLISKISDKVTDNQVIELLIC